MLKGDKYYKKKRVEKRVFGVSRGAICNLSRVAMDIGDVGSKT